MVGVLAVMPATDGNTTKPREPVTQSQPVAANGWEMTKDICASITVGRCFFNKINEETSVK